MSQKIVNLQHVNKLLAVTIACSDGNILSIRGPQSDPARKVNLGIGLIAVVFSL